MVKAVIWDFDGTLYDTYPGMITAFMAALEEAHLTADEGQVHLSAKKGSLKELFDTFASLMVTVPYPMAKRQLQTTYHKREAELNAHPQPYPGAKEVLAAVKEAGAINLLWTHRDDSAWDILADAGIRDLFAGGTTASMTFKRKPDPESVLYLLDKFDLSPQDVLVVGDRRIDGDAAHAAGCQSLYLDVDELDDAPDADYKAPSLEAAIPVIQEFLAK